MGGGGSNPASEPETPAPAAPKAEPTPVRASRPLPTGAILVLAMILISGLLGLIYLPMALALNAAYGSPFACLNPAFVLRSMWATRKDYTLCVLVFFGVSIMVAVLQFLTQQGGLIFFVAGPTMVLLGMYGWIVQMRALGLFFRYNQLRLGWNAD